MARTSGHGFLTSREVSYWKALQYIQAMSQLLCVQLQRGLPLQDSCSPEFSTVTWNLSLTCYLNVYS